MFCLMLFKMIKPDQILDLVHITLGRLVGVFFGLALLKYLRHNPGSAVVTKNNLRSIVKHYDTRLVLYTAFT